MIVATLMGQLKITIVKQQLCALNWYTVPTVGSDHKKLQCMRDIQVPKCKKDVERLLGSFRTFSAYNPECALVTPFLRRLTWKGLPFEWGNEEED